jgi:hypothetical protein
MSAIASVARYTATLAVFSLHNRRAFGALAMMPSGIETALAQDTVRVRGTIERIDGSTYVVKARDGAELRVTIADNPQIAGVVKASLSDIKQGSFVGVTAMPRADGSQTALEVHIFPDIVAIKQSDGTLQGRAWRVGRDGVTPPM